MRLLPTSRAPHSWLATTATLVLASALTSAIQLNVNDVKSVKRASEIAAKDMMSYYHGDEYGGTPGLLPYPPYYWWQAGSMWMTLIHYWFYTGDSQFNKKIMDGMMWQTGVDANFILPNQSFADGNDDQAFWAFAAMEAAELKFPNPPKDKPQWLALAQAVFNVQVLRFTDDCGGGLPWQVNTANAGYLYKNTISNGCFFSLAARLARYTGNDTYAKHAISTYDWMENIGLITPQYNLWDGASILDGCKKKNGIQWSYNLGVVLHGASFMWNHTRDQIWKTRINGFLDRLEETFIIDDVLWEFWCEESTEHPCNVDQQSFKGYLAQWLGVCAQLAPWTYDRIMPILTKSAQAAAAACTGGNGGTQCGLRWTINGTTGQYDGETGPPEQIAALSVLGTMMIPFLMKDPKKSPAPVTHVHGISQGNASAGLGGTSTTRLLVSYALQIDTADRVGAWIVTVILALLTLGGGLWLIREESLSIPLPAFLKKRGYANNAEPVVSETAGSKSSLQPIAEATVWEKSTSHLSVRSPVIKSPERVSRRTSGIRSPRDSIASGNMTPRNTRQPPPSPTPRD